MPRSQSLTSRRVDRTLSSNQIVDGPLVRNKLQDACPHTLAPKPILPEQRTPLLTPAITHPVSPSPILPSVRTCSSEQCHPQIPGDFAALRLACRRTRAVEATTPAMPTCQACALSSRVQPHLSNPISHHVPQQHSCNADALFRNARHVPLQRRVPVWARPFLWRWQTCPAPPPVQPRTHLTSRMCPVALRLTYRPGKSARLLDSSTFA